MPPKSPITTVIISSVMVIISLFLSYVFSQVNEHDVKISSIEARMEMFEVIYQKIDTMAGDITDIKIDVEVLKQKYIDEQD